MNNGLATILRAKAMLVTIKKNSVPTTNEKIHMLKHNKAYPNNSKNLAPLLQALTITLTRIAIP